MRGVLRATVTAFAPLLPGYKRLPEAGAVDVWQASLSALTPYLAALDAALSPPDRRRADRNVFPAGRRRAIASRGLLRCLLGQYLGLPPSEVPIRLTRHGKPFVPHPLQFSVTHSEDVIAYAFCLGTAVGIDVERVDPAIPVLQLAEQVFSESELRRFKTLPPNEKAGVLLAAWTCKEALLKAAGDGLTKPMTGIDLGLRSPCQPRLGWAAWQPRDSVEYRVGETPLRDGYVAALAIESAVEAAVFVRDMPPLPVRSSVSGSTT